MEMNHIILFENFSKEMKNFTDSEISYWSKIWDMLHLKYINNPFFSKIFKLMKQNKSLTKNQWIELEFLLKNGKSRYEAGVLSTKN
jgi:hypothetical protein